MPDLKKMPELVSVLVVLLSGIGCSGQNKNTTNVHIASPTSVQAGHAGTKALLPSGATNLRFDDKQAVTVDGPPPLTLLPVSFNIPMKDAIVEGQMRSLCGVVVTPQGGTSALVVTLGTGNTEMMSCTGVKAVGGAPSATSGARPDLVLIYETYTGHESLNATILLTWDATSGMYGVDDALSQWLGEQKEGQTIVGARRLLASKRHGAPSHS